jgi:chromosome segregation ATPase
VYDHPELRAEIERRAAQVADRFTTTVTAGARVTGASLRADLENIKAQNRRLRDQVAALGRRLGETVAEEVRPEMTGRGERVTDDTLRARIEALEENLADVRGELARRIDELEAARQINRELMARLNREHRDRDGGNACNC